MRRGAFTFIELIAVITLMGLLAAAVAFSLAEDSQRGAEADVLGRIVHADRMARLAAQRLDRPCALRFDLDRRRIQRASDDGGDEVLAHALQLPAGFRIARLMTPQIDAPALGAIQTKRGLVHESGVVDIAYSRAGRSISYALQVIFPDDRAQWLLLAGLTGQVSRFHDPEELDRLFQMLVSGGLDAD